MRSGVGKSHILQALGRKACVHGYRVLYRTSAKLISDLTASLAWVLLERRHSNQWSAPPGWSETGQLAAFTHLMDDANVVPETERSRYPW